MRADPVPKVSIIIPAYNAVRYLDEAIRSVLAQEFNDYEMILVDDGSTDDTLRVARRYAKRLKIVSLPHCGPSAARNAGIRRSVGEYLAFLDADDLLLPAKLTHQAAYLDSHPDVDVVYSNGYCVWSQKDGSQRRRSFSQQGLLLPSLGAPQESLPELAIQNGFPIHTALARREAILTVGGFDENLFGREDWDLWLRVGETHRFAFLDIPVAVYRQLTNGVTSQYEHQALAVRHIGSKVESKDWFQASPARLRSSFYFSWGVQELEYRQTRAALERLSMALSCDPGNYRARAALLSVRILGSRAAWLYHLQRQVKHRRSPGSQSSRLAAAT